MMHRRLCLPIALVLALGLGLTLFWLVGASLPVAHADPGILYVSPGGTCDVIGSCYSTVQAAADAAQNEDEIRVAGGTYLGVNNHGSLAQSVYLTKTLTIRGGYHNENWSDSDPVANPTILDAQGQGRVVYITGSIAITLEALTLTGGNANGVGGAINDPSGGGLYAITASLTLSNCHVFSNTTGPESGSGSYGGGVHLDSNDSVLLTGNTVVSNTARYGGGVAIIESFYSTTLNGNTIISNTACSANCAGGQGGGLYIAYGPANLNENTLQGNTAGGHGGGLRLLNGSNSTLVGNTIINNSTIHTNGGGAVFWGGSNITLTGNRILSNTAGTDTGGLTEGGGLYFQGSNMTTLTSNIVTGNTANAAYDGRGGGLFFFASDHLALDDNTVTSNTASTAADGEGGGVAFYGCDYASLDGNTVTGNTASSAGEGKGGGLYFFDSHTATLTVNTVTGNRASSSSKGWGGGLALYNSDSASLSGGTITGNTASTANEGKGGGLYVSGSDPFTLTNNLVARNQASGLWFHGEASGVGPTSGILLHNTIADNQSSGQGVYAGNFTSLVLTNTIIAGHAGVGITATAGSTVSLAATLWYSNGVDVGGSGSVSRTLDLYGDPAFVDPAAWDYHLGSGSAAIDRGIDAGVITDLDGGPRPLGAAPDPGAYEAGSALALQKTASDTAPEQGETITFTIVVTNTGAFVTGGLVSDSLPTGLNFLGPIDLDPPGAGSVGTEPPLLASGLAISAGQRLTLTFPVSVAQSLEIGSELVNSAYVTAAEVITPVWTSATLTVANSPPVAVDDGGTGFGTDEDTAFATANVLPNDGDANGDTLSVVGHDTPGTVGQVTDNGDGTFGYDPDGQFEDLAAGEQVTDTFSYTLGDGRGGVDTATVTITIDGVDDSTSYEVFLPVVLRGE